MGQFVAAAKNAMLDALTVDRLSLHNGVPGTDGLSNEISGGSPAYARKAAVYDAAASGVSSWSWKFNVEELSRHYRTFALSYYLSILPSTNTPPSIIAKPYP